MPWANVNWETLLPITHERGYLIPAIGEEYERCAQQLRDSILHLHPAANVTIVTADMLPHGDLGGWANDWQMFSMSPYRETIKLEADMLIVSPIAHWWDQFRHRDVVISTGCRDWQDRVSTARNYRRVFDVNHLQDVYNDVTYWRRSTTAKEFFSWVSNIFANWTEFKKLIKFPDETPSTDLVYAMAAEIMGVDRVTMPFSTYPKIVHMKRHTAGTATEDWTKELVWEYQDCRLRIQTVAQTGAFHYNVKEWRA